MSLSMPTMASLRYGYGLRPGEKPAQSVDDLIAQVASGVATVPLAPIGGVALRRQKIIATEASLRDARARLSKKEQLDLEATVRKATLPHFIQDNTTPLPPAKS